MKLPFVSRKKYDKAVTRIREVIKESDQHELANQLLATKFKRIQEVCEEHNRGFRFMANNRFVSMIKDIVGK
jgi:hypothetical protein